MADQDLPGLRSGPVGQWIADHVDGVTGPVTFSLIAGGHSNLTYLAQDANGRRVVVRRPPLRAGASGAHDVAREHRVLTALAPTDVPVATPLALCEDESVNERPFYVMDCVPGAALANPEAADRALPSPAARRTASNEIVDVLARVHRVDIDAVGLGGAARREGFLDRQLKRMQRLWHETKTRELPLIDELHDRLAASAPPQRFTGIVHSDYKMGNVLLDGDGHLTAVLDWELWTLGDVLADLGFLLNSWYEPGDDAPLVWMEVPPTVAPGFASRDEVADRYAAATGAGLDDLGWYRAFQYWKLGVLAEGVKRRYETAAMASGDVDFDHLDRRVVNSAELAHQQLVSAGAPGRRRA